MDFRRGHGAAGTGGWESAGWSRCGVAGLSSFQSHASAWEVGIAHWFDAPSGPATLVFALGAFEIRGDAPVHVSGAD